MKFDGHETVKHGAGEFSCGNVHVNTAESYFALLKRGVHEAFHHVSKEHLFRYCNEFSFRWTCRKMNDDERTAIAVSMAGCKMLPYKPLLG